MHFTGCLRSSILKYMKIIKKNEDAKKYRTLTLRIDEEVMKKIDYISEKNEVSRQKLIEKILEKVVAMKDFIIEIE
jgi:predicted HicB family RNase H-like nuclease